MGKVGARFEAGVGAARGAVAAVRRGVNVRIFVPVGRRGVGC